MLHLKAITYSIGERELLRQLDWIISPGQRVALIGANGVGKTTLLRIMTGELSLQSGTIMKPKEYRIGYLPQEAIDLEPNAILDSVLQGRSDVVELERKIERLRAELAESADALQLGETLGRLEHQFEHAGGYKLESDAREILAGLGFKKLDYHRPIQEFSGGWRMRVYLARLLLQQPHLLLLDEPTNHLDLAALEWLEEYLSDFSGSIVIVSHDRFFIDRIASEICELRAGELRHYAGNYHFYEQQRMKDRDLLAKRAEQLQKEKQKQQIFIDRFRYKNTKATQVQSRIKRLQKMAEIEPESIDQQLDFQLAIDAPSYKDALTIEELAFRYAEEWILQHIHLRIYRGQKIALVGDNGAGKTTLTRLMVGQLTPQHGSIVYGHRVSIGYYAQHQVDALNIDSTAYDEVSSAVSPQQLPNIRNILGLFGLRGDDIYKKIAVLSGGEKARVSLTKILLSPVNFLIMDEPTNHLDMRSKEALENALMQYNGTLILISHDRYFLDKIVSKVIELHDGVLTEYEGDYTAYLEKRRQRYALSEDEDNSPKNSKKSRDERRRQAQARQAVSKRRNELKQAIEKYENLIDGMEKRKIELERLLSDPLSYKSSESAASFTKEYHQIKDTIELNLDAWGVAQQQLQELLSELDAT
ncbi:ABC-F family ATP-binding cassette domain-containing protein [candidate division KSB1 bacterium]|nr:ABC-F family ATP-binding cassette domain-containing protein [candidate division KSB1 bacterium]RQW11457.1 MAG: ABC transporter ATP-binding protein [candidate division KSB1 bacterium]